VGRALLTLAWIILLLLLIDSAMHDPDVQPVMDRQITRVERSLGRIADWFRAQRAGAKSDLAADNPQSGLIDNSRRAGPVATWYWSTTLGMAATLAGLAKSTRRTVCSAPAARLVRLRAADRRVGRRP
jgi:hypothetical protein